MLQNLDIVPSTESRNELLAWLNETMPQVAPNGTHIAPIHKVEQCGNGVPYILTLPTMLPILYPPLKSAARVKIPAQHDFEAVANLKLMQDALQRNGITRPDVLLYHTSKLIKGNFQANLQLLQWFKGLYDALFVKDVEQSLRRGSARGGSYTAGTNHPTSATSPTASHTVIPSVASNSPEQTRMATTSTVAKPTTGRVRSPSLPPPPPTVTSTAVLSSGTMSSTHNTATAALPASALSKPEQQQQRTPHPNAASRIRRNSEADSEARAVNAQGDAAAAAALALLTGRADMEGETNTDKAQPTAAAAAVVIRRGSLGAGTQRSSNNNNSPSTNTPIIKHLPATMAAAGSTRPQRVSMSPPRELEQHGAPSLLAQTTSAIGDKVSAARRLATPRSRSHSDSNSHTTPNRGAAHGRPKSAQGLTRGTSITSGVRPRTPRSPSHSASYTTQGGRHGSTPRVSSTTTTTNTTKNTNNNSSSTSNGMNNNAAATGTPRSPSLSHSLRKTRATTPSQARPAANRTRLNEAPPVSFATERKAGSTPRLLSSTTKAKTRLTRTTSGTNNNKPTGKRSGNTGKKKSSSGTEDESTSVSPDVSEARLATPQQVTSTTSFTSCVEGNAGTTNAPTTTIIIGAEDEEEERVQGTHRRNSGDFLRRGDAAVVHPITSNEYNSTTTGSHMILHRARSPVNSPNAYPIVEAQPVRQQDARKSSLSSTHSLLTGQTQQQQQQSRPAEATMPTRAGLSPNAQAARGGSAKDAAVVPTTTTLDLNYLHQVERERQFFYDKLRTIETMVAPLAAHESVAEATEAMRLARSICTVLYMPD